MHAVEAKGKAGRPPGTKANRVGLTDRQAAIIAFIEREVGRQGYPPSMREIGHAVKLKSTSSVSHQLTSLERKGFLYRDPHRPQAYRVRARWTKTVGEDANLSARSAVDVPLIGRIAAGAPILAEEEGRHDELPHLAAGRTQRRADDDLALLGGRWTAPRDVREEGACASVRARIGPRLGDQPQTAVHSTQVAGSVPHCRVQVWGRASGSHNATRTVPHGRRRPAAPPSP